jgi:hypothetical protein
MINPRWVTVHGKHILVETLEYPPKDRARRTTKRKRFEVDWVKLPNYWIEQLEHSCHLGTYKLAHRVLREAYKRQHVGGEVVLSAAVTGLPRATRWSATKELVKLNLIRIQQDGRQGTRVTELLFKRPSNRGRNGQ